jgi:hypothetical protein
MPETALNRNQETATKMQTHAASTMIHRCVLMPLPNTSCPSHLTQANRAVRIPACRPNLAAKPNPGAHLRDWRRVSCLA